MSVVHEGTPTRSANGLGAWLARIAPRSASGELTIAIVPDARVKALNRRYRHINKVTDVLAFPSGAVVDGDLGDIVIACETARKQAKTMGHPVGVEFRVLALHGLLHLLGYDHEVDGGRMARTEARLRRKAGLPLGLIARS